MGQLTLLCLSLLAASSSGNQGVVREQVDMIEVNHFHDDLGRHIYDQVVFYGWSAAAGDYHVRAWCLLDEPSRWPRRNQTSGLYHVRWYDRDQRIQREVVSKHYLETWTQVDPERANKKLLDEKYRTALARPNRERPKQLQQSVADNQLPAKIR